MEGLTCCLQTLWMGAQTGCALAGLCGQVVARSQGAGLSNLPQDRWGRTSPGLGLGRGFPKATGPFTGGPGQLHLLAGLLSRLPLPIALPPSSPCSSGPS